MGMKYTFAGLVLGVALTVASATVYADKIPYEIEYDYLNGNVKVSVPADEVKTDVSIAILKSGKTESDYVITPGVESNLKDTVLYCGQTNEISDGKYLFDIDYENVTTGNCVAYLNAVSEEKTVLENFVIVDPEDFKNAVVYVNDAAKEDAEGFMNALRLYKTALGFNSVLEGLTDMNKAMGQFKAYIEKNPLSESEFTDNVKLYKTFVLMEAINSDKIETLDEHIDDIYADDEIIADYKAKAKSETISKYIVSKLTNELTTPEQFNTELKKAMLFTYIKYADGYGEVVSAVEKYGNVAGISTDVDVKACKRLVGKDYSDIEELLSDYEEKENTAQKPSGGGGSASGGTSRVQGSSSAYISPVKSEPVQSIKPIFDDIEGIDWAYEAIAALCDKNIINGKGENRFAPNDAITREEFAKIVVCALGLQNENVSENQFADANDGAWYVNYINIAANHGICRGMGGNIFGVGRNITRQDMTVMLYNAMIAKGKTLGSAELGFEDAGSIADYAREAIKAMYAEGIITGVSETEIDPIGTATRAQAAVMVWRVMNKLQ